VALSLATTLQRLDAQITAPHWGVGVAAGPAFPVGEFSTTDNPGLTGLAFFSYRLDAAFSLGLDVGATWTPHKGSGHSELYDILAGVVWRPVVSASPAQLLLLGSVGGVAVDIDNPAKARPAFSAGAGVTFGRGNGRLFVLGRYVRIVGLDTRLAYIPLTIGYSTRTP
jgi:hypothetical protein